jgi:coenzyme PQQ synthesis protein D (PqqD)
MTDPRYRRHPDLRLTALEGEGVVLHLKERRYFTVNETGLTLLEALKEPRSMEDLVSALQAEYEVTDAEARDTTRVFLTQCLEAAVVLEEAG